MKVTLANSLVTYFSLHLRMLLIIITKRLVTLFVKDGLTSS